MTYSIWLSYNRFTYLLKEWISKLLKHRPFIWFSQSRLKNRVKCKSCCTTYTLPYFLVYYYLLYCVRLVHNIVIIYILKQFFSTMTQVVLTRVSELSAIKKNSAAFKPKDKNNSWTLRSMWQINDINTADYIIVTKTIINKHTNTQTWTKWSKLLLIEKKMASRQTNKKYN